MLSVNQNFALPSNAKMATLSDTLARGHPNVHVRTSHQKQLIGLANREGLGTCLGQIYQTSAEKEEEKNQRSPGGDPVQLRLGVVEHGLHLLLLQAQPHHPLQVQLLDN